MSTGATDPQPFRVWGAGGWLSVLLVGSIERER